MRAQQQAGQELTPERVDPDTYSQKYLEYFDFSQELVRRIDMSYRYVVDRETGTGYLYRQNPLVIRIMEVIGSELLSWFGRQEVTPSFASLSARAGLGLMLTQRKDLVALLRIAQTLPLDVEVSQVPVDRPAVVEAVELAIGLVPVVGNVVAAYEAYTGRDLFGYHLTDVERGILAATVLLPIAGRLVKSGRAIYTEARLVALYGRDARAWTRTMAAGGRAVAEAEALRALVQAEAALRTSGRIEASLAQAAAASLPRLVGGSGAAQAALHAGVPELLEALASRFSVLRSLDGPALQRVLERGPNIDHLKGQLLEELIESRIVPWLSTREGAAALGVSAPGRTLEFFPGHLIRDAAGRQITDGIIGYRNNGVLEIVAIFEAKAGRRAARELSMTSGSISSLGQAERAELRAFARDILREEREIARLEGRAHTRTVDDVEREIIISERGGQVRRDIERLHENADGTLARIWVGANSMPVRATPAQTKFFGVLPRDVNPALMEGELRASNFRFEMIGVDMTQRNLRDAAADMVNLARTIADAP